MGRRFECLTRIQESKLLVCRSARSHSTIAISESYHARMT